MNIVLTKKSLPDQISYRVAGTGEPVMLVHGFGEDSEIWMEQVNELSADFKCILPDLPGTGFSSSAFSNQKDLSVEGFAALLKSIAEHEGIEKFAMIGHSMGGYITLAFAEKYPDMLKGFGLVHSSAYADNEEKISSRKKSIDFIKKNGAKVFLEQLVQNLYGEGYKKDHQADIEAQVERSKDIDPEVLIAYTEIMIKRPDRSQVLSTFEKPVLFIMGTEDKIVNLSDGLAQSHIPAQSHVHILEFCGHMGMKEKSAQTTSALRTFLLHLNEN